MSHDIIANYLMHIFAQETSIQHALDQKQIKRLSKELAAIDALENNDMLTDSMLDHKRF